MACTQCFATADNIYHSMVSVQMADHNMPDQETKALQTLQAQLAAAQEEAAKASQRALQMYHAELRHERSVSQGVGKSRLSSCHQFSHSHEVQRCRFYHSPAWLSTRSQVWRFMQVWQC